MAEPEEFDREFERLLMAAVAMPEREASLRPNNCYESQPSTSAPVSLFDKVAYRLRLLFLAGRRAGRRDAS